MVDGGDRDGCPMVLANLPINMLGKLISTSEGFPNDCAPQARPST